MPKPTTELTHEEYIKSLGLEPALEQELFGVLGKPEVWAKAKTGILRQSDYSRQLDALRTKEAEVEALRGDVDHWRTELTEWDGKTKNEVESDRKKLAESELALKQREIKLRDAAREIGLTDEQIFGATPPTPPVTAPQTSVFDESRFVSREDSAKYLRESVMLQADQLDMLDEHHRLFPDKPIKIKELVTEAISHRKTPSQWWEEKFNVAAVRQERADAAIAERIETARREGIIEGRSMQGQPTRNPQPSSALFGGDRNKRPDRNNLDKSYMQNAINDVWKRADFNSRKASEYDN